MQIYWLSKQTELDRPNLSGDKRRSIILYTTTIIVESFHRFFSSSHLCVQSYLEKKPMQEIPEVETDELTKFNKSLLVSDSI